MDLNIKQRIETVITNLDQLPSIPEVATKIMNMVNDPDVAFKKVADEISKDQAMTTNILKVCNSAFFSKGKEITSIEKAIVTMGLKEVKDIVILIVAKPVLDKAIIGYDMAKGDLWMQGLAVATLSKRIAMKKKRKEIADIVFTGGLIHNVGKVVLALYVQNVYKDIIAAVEEKQMTFDEAEREVMGFDHHQVGEKMLDKWKFPPVLKSIVRYYHDPVSAPVEHRFDVSVVHIANIICLMAGIGIGSDGLFHQFNSSAIKSVGLNEGELEELYSSIPELIKEIKALM